MELHRWLAGRRPHRPDVLLGMGDDCAVVRADADGPWVLKVDPTLEGQHFEVGSRDALAIARKAVHRPASDLAALAAQPCFALLSLEVPRGTPPSWIRQLIRGVETACRRLGGELVGGHTASSAPRLALHVTWVGRSVLRRPWSRRRARPGDLLLATGAFGGSRLGKHRRFQPRIREALALAASGEPVHAAVDVSDGLALDAGRLAAASHLRLVLEAGEIPIAPAARRLAQRTGEHPLSHALSDGEDYELLLATPPRSLPGLLRTAKRHRFVLSRLGRFEHGSGVYLADEAGALAPVEPRGYVQRFV
ncbi:MAG: thiamine-phosphate kinase [Planctomycetes bacterium]|nr:thiamine-phosphate kinase [Planctomycetota bacterium]